MPICLRVPARWPFLFAFFILCLPINGASQQSSQTLNPPSPAPRDVLLAAANANGLARPTLTPWHIKISFESLDGHGHALSQGTFEEFWAGPGRYKRIFATNNFNQVEYLTGAGVRRIGSPDGAPSELMMIVDQFLHPIALDQDSIDAASLQMTTPSVGETKLACVTVSPHRSTTAPLTALQALQARLTKEAVSNETYCMDENAPVLRLQLSTGGTSKFARNSVIRFQDCYLPQTVEEYEGSSPAPKPTLTAKLEKIESITSTDDAQFRPPASATPPPNVIALTERETKPQLLHHPFPEYDFRYPGENRSVHMAAIVVISLQVQTDGRVSNLRVERTGGPPALQQASLDAVRNWTYKPFIRNGEPVEVNTTVTLVYSLTP